MKQMEVAKWLKGITIVIGLMGLLFFFVVMPLLAEEMASEYPEVAFLYWPGMIYGWAIGALCYAVLYQFYQVCRRIGQDRSFSMENAKAFVVISRLLLVMGGIWFGGILFLAVFHWLNPAIMILMILAVLCSMILAILSAALSHLIRKAYELEQECELTI